MAQKTCTLHRYHTEKPEFLCFPELAARDSHHLQCREAAVVREATDTAQSAGLLGCEMWGPLCIRGLLD